MRTKGKTVFLAVTLLLLLVSCATAEQAPRVLPPVPEDANIAHPSVTALEKVDPEKAREREQMLLNSEESAQPEPEPVKEEKIPEVPQPVKEEEVVQVVAVPEPEPEEEAAQPVEETLISEPVKEIPVKVEKTEEIPVAVEQVTSQEKPEAEAEPQTETGAEENGSGAWPYVLIAAAAAVIALIFRSSARRSSVKKQLNRGYTLLCLTGDPNSIIFARVRDSKIINEIKRTFDESDTQDSRGYYKERVKLFIDKDDVVCFDAGACSDMLFAATGEELEIPFVDLKELAKKAFPAKTIETKKDFYEALSLPHKADPAASMNLAYRRVLFALAKKHRGKEKINK